MPRYDDHQASSYDVEHCGWSNLPEDDFIQHDDRPYCMGEFVWTGFDYLGEPTPYYSDWPSHSSLFGIIDLAGIPKDRYWLYRSKWNPEAETLHILPHWNWKGREGEVTPVFIYTNYPEAELFINGRSQGRRRKDTGVTIDNSADSVSAADLKRQRRYRLMWMDTRYEPGTVKAVAYDEEGNAVAEREIRTAGEPYRIVLEADRRVIAADGKDYAFVTVRVEDRQGHALPAGRQRNPVRGLRSGVLPRGSQRQPRLARTVPAAPHEALLGDDDRRDRSDRTARNDNGEGDVARPGRRRRSKSGAKPQRSGKRPPERPGRCTVPHRTERRRIARAAVSPPPLRIFRPCRINFRQGLSSPECGADRYAFSRAQSSNCRRIGISDSVFGVVAYPPAAGLPG